MDVNRLEDMIRRLEKEGTGDKRDLLPIYADREALDALVAFLAEPFRGKVDCVCAPESLGFIIGSMLARELGVGLVVIRRNQQFLIDQEKQVTASYINHRDQVTTLITERRLLPAGSRVLLADDWITTAATIQTCATMIEDAGCKVAGIAAVGADHSSTVKGMLDSGNIICAFCEKE
jgi:adenine phosphoribosyltransferase